MVTTKEKKPCPVCGVMIALQGVAGHKKSKVHLEALAKQQEQQELPKVETTKEQVKQDVKPEEESKVKGTKLKETVPPKEPKPKELDQPGKEYEGLEW